MKRMCQRFETYVAFARAVAELAAKWCVGRYLEYWHGVGLIVGSHEITEFPIHTDQLLEVLKSERAND